MERYYYAAGKRVPLVVDRGRIGIDGARAIRAGLEDVVARVGKIGTKVPGEVLVVAQDAIPEGDLAKLRKAGAARPIYKVGNAITLPLAEVRVKLGTGQRKAALEAVKAASIKTEIAESTNERLVLRPISGSGEDALELANFIYERARPASSAASMVQIVPRPVR
jgi:hypothetical protein